MNKKTVISVIVAMTLASSGLAFGQGNSSHNDRGNKGDDRGRHEQSQRAGPPDRHDDRRPDYRDNHRPDRYDNRARYNPDNHNNRGAGPNNSWHRGDRIPVQYRSHQYVVDDWRGYHLSAPPRGYHWVQSGGDYLLVAIATGVILQLLINN